MRHPAFLSYDNAGDLFLEFISIRHRFIYAELRKGATTFEKIAFDKMIYPNGVQWDGKYIAIGNGSAIYRTIGSQVVSTTHLDYACNSQFFIRGARIFVFCRPTQWVEVFKYPDGGRSIRTINVNPARLGMASGVVDSP